MLPFSAFSAKLLIDHDELELSILELSPSSMLIRLPKGFAMEEHAISAVCFELRFYDRETAAYKVLCVVPAGIHVISRAKYYNVYRIEIEDENYSAAVKCFSRRYLDYIDARQSLDDAELAEKLLYIPASTEKQFAHDIQDWRSCMFAALRPDREWGTVVSNIPERAVSLNSHSDYTAYLKYPIEEYLRLVWQKNCLAEHPVAFVSINCLYVGSAYCSFQQPDAALLKKIIEKAKAEGMKTVLVLSPMKTGEEAERRRFLSSLDVIPDEIVINDIGTAMLIKEQLSGVPVLRLGTLPDRHTRDPRQRSLANRNYTEENMLNSKLYLDWLRDCIGISHFSTELWKGCSLPTAPTAVHLPYVRTNTSGRCTLRAVCRSGDRGAQDEPKNCENYCEKSCFIYPDVLKTIGRYNSLFTVNTDALSAADYIPRNAERIVFNFI